MNFKRKAYAGAQVEPEINLIPFIDVLLVVLIFLMLTTTYSRFNELGVRLPSATADTMRQHPKELIVAVSGDGRYALNKQILGAVSSPVLTANLAQAAVALGAATPEDVAKSVTLIISADGQASHQNVVAVMEAARVAGISKITFATQK